MKETNQQWSPTTSVATATRWAESLRESKVHVVAAVLDLVGEETMKRIASDARVVYERGEARSLGGAFMRVLKTIVVATSQTTTESLHDVAKRVGGERDLQRARVSRRRRRMMMMSSNEQDARTRANELGHERLARV